MAKTTSKKAPPPAKRPVSKQEVVESNVDVTLLMRQHAGEGISTSAEDNIIPLIYILQAQSPQCLKQKPEYIKGATAGNIWPRGTTTLIDGDEGMPVIPCGMRKWWIEWKPDRGGFVGRHEYDEADSNKGRPDDATSEKDPKSGIPSWVRSDGNVLVETREHAVLAFIEGQWSPYVIAMSGSNHVVSRTWNGEWMRKRLAPPNDNFIPPAFAFVYNMKTIAASNDKGDWYKWTFENGMGDGEKCETTSLDNGVELFRMALALKEAFLSGAKHAEPPADLEAASNNADDDSI